MEEFSNVSSDQCDLDQTECVPNNLPIDLFDDSSTQDVTEFNYSAESIFDDDQHSNNHSEKMSNEFSNESTNDSQVLKINVSSYFKNINQTNILSPVSELAMNVALTKLDSAVHLTGKFDCKVSCFIVTNTQSLYLC